MNGGDGEFYAAAERRIWRFQLIIAIAGTAAAWRLGGPGAAPAFATGAAVSSLNFLWLKQAVDALAENLARRKRRLLVWKFLARYVLIALAAYGILKHTAWDVRALLAGLFLFVAAILAEIFFEIVAALLSDPDGT